MTVHTAKLIGMNSSRYRLLKELLEQAIAAIPHRIRLQEVNSLDQILNHAVSAIPAVLIDNLVIYENGSSPQQKQLLQQLYANLDKLLNIHRIVVPIDFSKNAIQAYQFAQHLAVEFNSQISLLHVVHVYANTSLPEANTLDYSIERAEKELKKFAAEYRLKEAELTKIYTTVKLGFAGDSIVQYTEDEQTDLVLMGTKGTSSWHRQLLGSVSIKVAKEATCPVLLVPPGCMYKGFNNVLFANDSTELSSVLELLIERLHETFHIIPHVMYINNISDDNAQSVVQKALTSSRGHIYQSIHLKNSSVVDGIYTYTKQHAIDLTVIFRRHRAFFDRLTHKSQTKQIAMQATVPLLVFPK